MTEPLNLDPTRNVLGLIDALQAQVNRRFTEQDEHVKEALDAVSARLTEMFEAAQRMADVLRNEHQRSSDVAEKEREKSAAALRDALDRAREEGDNSLRQHIDNQIQQIADALASAEKLEIQRVDAVRALVQGIEREIKIAAEASEKAIEKAETAANSRFESVNEFRAQLADQSSQFLPRETFETTVTGWSQWREQVDRTLAISSGTRQGLDAAWGYVIGAAGVIAAVVAVVVR